MKVVAGLCAVLALGCQQTSLQGTHLRLEMSAPQQDVLFLVDDTKVSYGGGLNAVENKTTWHGSMTAKQHSTFTDLVSKWGTIGKSAISKGVGKYKIRLQEDSLDRTFELPLTDTTATKVYGLLMKVADARFKTTLDALPKPSVDAMLQNRGLGKEQ